MMKKSIPWIAFIVVLGLIVWGMVVASHKASNGSTENTIPLPSPVTSADWSRGPANAPVTLVEYGDFQCPACQAYYPVVEQVLASSTVPIHFVFRHFPLPQHTVAIPAAKAAEAAGIQGKFWDMFKALYSHPDDWQTLADPTSKFVQYATQLGLNVAKFQTDMNSAAIAKKIADSVAAGTNAGIDYTPTFFVNGYRIENPESYEEFITDINNAASSTHS